MSKLFLSGSRTKERLEVSIYQRGDLPAFWLRQARLKLNLNELKVCPGHWSGMGSSWRGDRVAFGGAKSWRSMSIAVQLKMLHTGANHQYFPYLVHWNVEVKHKKMDAISRNRGKGNFWPFCLGGPAGLGHIVGVKTRVKSLKFNVLQKITVEVAST